MQIDETKIRREQQFWNQQAHAMDGGQTSDEALRVDPNDLFDKTMPWLPYLGVPKLVSELLDQLGPIAGKRILDMGTGTGFLATLLASKGAEVHAIDVSNESLEIARRRAKISGVDNNLHYYEMPCETLDFPDEHFDAVVGSFVLHHSDLDFTLKALSRVMKPGAPGCFIETWGGNPLLMLARFLIPGRFGVEKSSSDDERPLDRKAEILVKSVFPESAQVVFPDLLFLRMLTVIPFLKYKPVYWLLENLDRMLFKIPSLRSYAYFAVVAFRKAGQGN